MAILSSCYEFLSEHANATWYESFRIYENNTDKYVHQVNNSLILIRVETGNNKRAFYWLYSQQDAISFNEHVGHVLKWEAHEIIIRDKCKLFFDIDLLLDELTQCEFANAFNIELSETNMIESMNTIGRRVAEAIEESIIHSLYINSNVNSEDIDFMYTMRNRYKNLQSKDFKISIHLITNIFVSVHACSAIAKDIKENVLQENYTDLGLDDNIFSYIVDAIDDSQYRLKGSLGLPHGVKHSNNKQYKNTIYKPFGMPNQTYLITVDNEFNVKDIDLDNYDIQSTLIRDNRIVDTEFVNEALRNVGNIKEYNSYTWDLNSSMTKGGTMYVKRRRSSRCSVCERIHDNDNTLFLIFDSVNGIASWKCSKNKSMKAIPFYVKEEEQDDDEDDIEMFIAKTARARSKTKLSNSKLARPETKLSNSKLARPETKLSNSKSARPETKLSNSKSAEPETKLSNSKSARPETKLSNSKSAQPETKKAKSKSTTSKSKSKVDNNRTTSASDYDESKAPPAYSPYHGQKLQMEHIDEDVEELDPDLLSNECNQHIDESKIDNVVDAVCDVDYSDEEENECIADAIVQINKSDNDNVVDAVDHIDHSDEEEDDSMMYF